MRLSKNLGHEKIPEAGGWLKSEKLFGIYKKMPLSSRRALSVAAVKASQAYGQPPGAWYKAMVSDVALYKKQRGKQLKSEDEKKKWPTGGFAALRKVATEFKRSIKNSISASSLPGLYAYSQYIILRFYSEVAFRNDLATVRIGRGKDGNRLTKEKGIYTIVMREFKASDKIGVVTVKLSKALSKAIDQYVKYRGKLSLDHDRLLVNSKGGALSKKGLGQILNKLTRKYLGKGFGTRMIRVLKVTSEKDALDKAAKLAHDMLHSIDTSQTYARK